MRRNVCSIRSIIDWLVATNVRLITFLCKHSTHSLKLLYPPMVERFKVLEQWPLKISLLAECCSGFRANAKVFSFSLAQKILSGGVPLRRHSKSAESKPAKHTKNITWLNFKTKFGFFSLKLGTWKQRKDLLDSKKSLQVMKVITRPGLIPLFWHGAVCSCLCFWIQQKFENTVCY